VVQRELQEPLELRELQLRRVLRVLQVLLQLLELLELLDLIDCRELKLHPEEDKEGRVRKRQRGEVGDGWELERPQGYCRVFSPWVVVCPFFLQ
jgi:hypothetical protein